VSARGRKGPFSVRIAIYVPAEIKTLFLGWPLKMLGQGGW
jgi:hypothetical protein